MGNISSKIPTINALKQENVPSCATEIAILNQNVEYTQSFCTFFFSKNVLIVTVVALVRVCVANVRN